VPVLALLASLPLSAQDTQEKIAGQVGRGAATAAKQATRAAQEAAFEEYKNAVLQVKTKREGEDPAYGQVASALRAMAKEYNKIFSNPSVPEEEKAELAATAYREVWTGWNSYRPINLKDILNTDFRQASEDEQVIEFEYYIRYFLLSSTQRENIATFKQNPKYDEFRKSYEDFATAFQALPSFDRKAMAKNLVNLVRAYNEVLASSKEDAAFIKRSAFAWPLLTGWGRTVDMDWYRKVVASHFFTDCGDGVDYYTPQELQEWYELSEEDAQALAKFTEEFHRPIQ
jgi:hypothetical protein